MSVTSYFHPKVLAGIVAAVFTNIATIAAASADARSWWEIAFAVAAIDGPLVVAWAKRANPEAGAVVEALEPVVEAKLAEKARDAVENAPDNPDHAPPPADVEKPGEHVIGHDPWGRPIYDK